MKILLLEAVRNISVVLAVLSVLDLNLTFGRYINDAANVPPEDNTDSEMRPFRNSTAGRTIDEIIASAATYTTYKSLEGDGSDPVRLVELDMLLTEDQYNALYGKQNTMDTSISVTSARKKRKAIKDQTYRWTNKRIPYRIKRSAFNASEREQINLAIQEWEKYTCITFQPATPYDSKFVSFEDHKKCYSYVGMMSGKQILSLGYGCRVKYVIVHEIGHAVGFFHEQSRPDRDDYVIIQTENIKHPDLYHNFQKYDWSAVSTYGVPYDYSSVMHYGGTAFSRNGQYTIVTKNPAFQKVIGKRTGLSFNDIKLANLMYNCSGTCWSSVRCPSHGFLGKDCQCWCPGNPVKKCNGN